MADLRVPILEGDRLRLEPVSHAHSAGMFALWSEPLVCEHSGPAEDVAGLPIELPAKTRSESDRLLEFWLDRARARAGFRWAVVLRGQGDFIGAVGFNSLGTRSEYAYHFVPRFWGRGLAGEASRLALGWSFERGATSVECFIEPGNAASIRLAERLGFQRTGAPTAEPSCYRLSRESQPMRGRNSSR